MAFVTRKHVEAPGGRGGGGGGDGAPGGGGSSGGGDAAGGDEGVRQLTRKFLPDSQEPASSSVYHVEVTSVKGLNTEVVSDV